MNTLIAQPLVNIIKKTIGFIDMIEILMNQSINQSAPQMPLTWLSIWQWSPVSNAL